MWMDGVPLSSWQKAKDKFDLTKSDIKELTNDILDFLNEFNIFKPSAIKKINLLADEQVDYNLIAKLVLEKNFRTHDAVLVSTAIKSGCEYFTTEDNQLRGVKLEHIKIIHPQTMLQTITKT
jgi:predicted nucleic acid-binding protein